MNRKVCAALSGVCLAVLSSGAQARDLTVSSPGGALQDAQREVYFVPFAKDSGVTLLEDSWTNGYGILQAKVQAGDPNWDVVQVESDELELGCSDGIYEPIDWSLMGNEDDFIPAAVSECGVGAVVWSTVLAYDGDRFKEGPASWADFWDVEKFPGKRGMRKMVKTTMEYALIADGVAPADVYEVLATPEGVDRAFRKLDELKPHIVWWDSAAQVVQWLASGEVTMAVATNGRVEAANKAEGRNFKMIWGGSIYNVDSWVILKGAENKDNAMKLIAYASQPERQAQFSNTFPYGPVNLKAFDNIRPDVAAKLSSHPDNLAVAIPVGTSFWVDNVEDLTVRFNSWISR